MTYKDNIIALIGLNSDDDPRWFERGEYIDAVNVKTGIPQEESKGGLVEQIKSSLPIALGLPSNEINFSILDAVIDTENNTAFLLCYYEYNDGTSNHKEFRIIKHKKDGNTIKTIYIGDAEAWGIGHYPDTKVRCYNTKFVYNKIIFTDYKNDVRMIDVNRIEATTDAGINEKVNIWETATYYPENYLIFYKDKVYKTKTSGIPLFKPPYSSIYDEIANVNDVYLNPVDPDIFTLGALPSLIAPTVSYQTDTTVRANHLRGKTWQFTYRYIYLDYRKSTFAPPSILPAPNQEETTDGKPVSDPSHNNNIKIELNTGNEEVRRIEVIARSSEDPATWFIIDRIDIVNDINWRLYGAGRSLYSYFYNNKKIEVIDINEVYSLYSYIPQKAKHLELIEGNRLVFGNIVEGYNKIGSNVEIDLSWEDLGAISEQSEDLTIVTTKRKISGEEDDVWAWYLKFILPRYNPGEGIFKIDIKTSSVTPNQEIIYGYNGTDSYPDTVIQGISDAINLKFGDNTTQPCPVSDPFGICAFKQIDSGTATPYASWDKSFVFTKTLITKINKYQSLKKGAVHSWGIIYRDKVGRMSPVIGSGEVTKYIPFLTENTQSNLSSLPKIDFKIWHKPPDWAESYEIVYGGNKSISWFLQLLGYNFSPGKIDHDVSGYSGNESDEDYRIRIKRAEDNTRERFNNWAVEEYQFQKGDRIRIIAKVSNVGIPTEENDYIYDAEITGVFTDKDDGSIIGEESGDVTYEWVYFKKYSDYSISPTKTGSQYLDNIFVEIYRPVLGETDDIGMYFTTGMTFPILTNQYGFKYHGGDTDQVIDSNGNVTNEGIVHNTSHDIWMYIRNFVDITKNVIFKIWSESIFPSDYYVTQKMTSQGLPIADIGGQENILTKRIRHGGKLNIGTQTNYIAKFDYNDYVDLNDSDGPIEGIRFVGFVLKIIQYKKVTSIYIGRREAFNADGSSQYLFTDNVFGSVRPELENYGTQNPESVMVHNRYLYFWDQNVGKVIRNSANGQIPISDYKMKKYFSKLAKTLSEQDKENRIVNIAYLPDFDEVMVMFGVMKNNIIKDCLFFSESGDNRWKYRAELEYPYAIIPYNVDNELYLASGEQTMLYKWLGGNDYLNIMGNARTGEIVLVSKADPLSVTIFKSIIAYIDGQEPEFTEIMVPAEVSSSKQDMTTNVYPEGINNREGVYYCQINRDINTPGTQSSQWKELNGNWLRGLFLRIGLKFTNTEDAVTLFSLIVNGTKSERSK